MVMLLASPQSGDPQANSATTHRHHCSRDAVVAAAAHGTSPAILIHDAFNRATSASADSKALWR